MLAFEKQVALVTGASSGIGRAIALALSDKGADVGLAGRDRLRLSLTAKVAERTANQTVCYEADFTDETAVSALAAGVHTDFGRLDILIHCAGCVLLGSVERQAVDELDLQYRINLRAPYLLTQLFLPMLRQAGGQVVFVNSTAGFIANAGSSQYSATKHALKALADSLRAEVNSDGIRVLSVFPGRTASPMQKRIHEAEGKEYHPEHLLQPEDVASVVVHALNLPRSAEVTDINVRPFLKS